MITLNGIQLPDSLQWVDEFKASTVTQTVKRTLSGGIVVYHGPNTAGVPMTLESLADQGWVLFSTVQALQSIAQQPGGVYTLLIRGTSYSVMFRHQDGLAFEATPVISNNAPSSGDYFTVKISLMTV